MTFLVWIEKGSLRQLIVDMEALHAPVLRRLTSYARSVGNKSDIRFTCWYQIKPRYNTDLSVWLGVFCPVATTKSWPLCEALLSAAEPRLSESFSRTDWLMIETLAQGASLKRNSTSASVPLIIVWLPA